MILSASHSPLPTQGGGIVHGTVTGTKKPVRRWHAERAARTMHGQIQHSWHCVARQVCTAARALDTSQIATLAQDPCHAANAPEHPGPQGPRPVQNSSSFSSQASVYRSVKRLQDARRTMEALQVLQQGLAQFPTDRHMLSLASSLLVSTNQLHAAASVLHKAVQLYPNHIPLITAAAMLEMRLEQFDNAVDLLKAGLARSPNNPVLLQVWGKVAAAAGHTDTARALFADAINAQPNLPHAYASWAQLEVDRGNIQQARALYQEALKSVGPHAPLLHAWGTLEQELGCWSTAKQLFEMSLKADPQHIPTYQKLGHLDWCQGNLAAARAWWQQGSSTPSGPCPHLLCFWARQELRIHNQQAARALLESALAFNPGFTSAKVLLAMLADRSGASDAASQVYNSVLPGVIPPPDSLDQTLDSTLDNPAAASQSNGFQSAATGAGSQGTAAQQGEALATMCAVCQYLTRQGRHEAAKKLLQSMEQLAPNNGYLCHMRGLACQQEGNMAEAMAWFQRGTSATVRDGSLLCWEGMSELLSFMGKTDLARRTWLTGAARAARPTYWHPAYVSRSSSTHPAASSSPAASVLAALQPIRQQLLKQSSEANGYARRSITEAGSTATAVPQHAQVAQQGGRPAAAASPADQVMPDEGSPEPSPSPPSMTMAVESGLLVGSQVPRQHQAVPTPPNRPTRPASPSQVAPGSQAAAAQASNSSASVETSPAGGDDSIPGWPYREHMRGGGLDVTLFVGVTSRYLRKWALFEKKASGSAAAEQLFEAASLKDPQDYKTWLAWAVFERRRGHLGAAAELFRRGVSVAPRNPHLWCAYANMLWRQNGDVNSAREALRRATSLCPRSVHLWLEWALLEWRGAGDPHAAMQLLKRGASVPGGKQHELLMQALEQVKHELRGGRNHLSRQAQSEQQVESLEGDEHEVAEAQ